MAARLSLTVIAKDAEADLATCLMSATGIVDELIVADTGSADRTRGVATQCGARVVDFPWCDSFAAARNASLEFARSEWAFWLDADEYVDDSNRQKLQHLLASLPDQNLAFVMKQRSPPNCAGAAALLVDHVRLFRNRPEHRWRYRVHEQILPALHESGAAIHWTDIVIEHTGYEDPAARRRKLERNLRLLHLDHSEHPDEPFILFNLGWAYADLGRPAEALPLLYRSQKRSDTGVSIMPLVYLLQVHCLLELGQLREALVACRAGRIRYPADAELLFREATLLQLLGEHGRAEEGLRQLLRRPAGQASDPLDVLAVTRGRFTSVNEGLRGHLARYHLGISLRAQGRHEEAELEWRSALDEQPYFAPARLALAELQLAGGRWAELEQSAQALENGLRLPLEALLLRARAHLARKDYGTARRFLELGREACPAVLRPRVLLSHLLLQTGQDVEAEGALHDVLSRDSRQVEAWCNLVKLLRHQKRAVEAAEVCKQALAHCPGDAELLLLHGWLLRELGDLPAAEACLLHLLEHTPDQAHLPRHQLALVYLAMGRATDAEAQWRALLAQQPDYGPAWQGLEQLYRGQRRNTELEQVIARRR